MPQALSRLTAWIGQRPVLFAGTIRDNIRFARPEATDDEVAEAARNARVAEFAAALPDGLDTPVGEGGYGLSGGQAQRVAIARAFLKNAPLLLLDEPTAHLDPATEAEVLDSLRRLALGRTVTAGQPLRRRARVRRPAAGYPRGTCGGGAGDCLRRRNSSLGGKPHAPIASLERFHRDLSASLRHTRESGDPTPWIPALRG